MPGTVYALLVGIDQYAGSVPDLRGCVADVTAIEGVLRSVAGDRLDPLVLTNEQATRTNVITAVREHLRKAGPDDVALLHYSGHGSQEPVAGSAERPEADRLDETLVLHDSRLPDQRDLADKELGALIAEVAARSPHLVVSLDCCHSGSGTRALEEGVQLRRVPADQRPRVDYLPGTVEVERALRPVSGWALARADHVLLAACRADQTAKELRRDGVTRGVYSVALEAALTRTAAMPTYRDLHREIATVARGRVRDQDPQLELTRAADLDRPFLGGALRDRRGAGVLTHLNRVGWVLDLGSVHGIPPVTGTETTHLAVLPPDSDPASAPSPVATGVLTAVQPDRSLVQVTPAGTLDETRAYPALLTALPLPPLRVSVTGAAGPAAALRARLTDPTDPERSALLTVVETAAEVEVEATDLEYLIGAPHERRALVNRVAGSDDAALGKAASALEHIARWTRLRTLHNPAPVLPADAVKIEIVAPGGDQGDGRLRLPYPPAGGPPGFALKVTNNTDRTLWFAVLDLTEPYGAFTDALPAGSAQLDGRDSETVELSGEIDDVLWRAGVTALDDVLKIVVSTTEFDPRPSALDELDVEVPTPRAGLPRDAGTLSSLDRLFRRAGTRRVRPRPEAAEPVTDWFTRDLVITTIRPAPGTAVPVPGRPAAEVAAGVTVDPHPTLRATVAPAHGDEATRDLDTPALPAVLRDAGPAAEPFVLLSTRDDADPLDALVLSGVSGAEGVTAEQPVRLRVQQPLAPGERLLPFAWDGEFFLPLGYGRADGDATEIVLQRLPQMVATQRDVVGSIRILFRKLIGSRLGMPFEYPLLRSATVDVAGALAYVDDRAAIRTAVARSDAVLLYVHGIIGDTGGMARSASVTDVAPAPQLVGARYGAVLTFDYENLNTSIEDNARALGERLAGVGLAAGHGKRLDVVAHSMGGLVCRYFIELAGGAGVVSRLVTLGAPNGGSPWPTVQKWATVAVTAALNGLTAVAWPAQVLSAVLGAVERLDVTMDEMEAGSELLARLHAAPDPAVPYTVLVGNRSLLAGPEPDGVLRRLLAKLSPRRIAGEVVDLAFLGKPNDLAVAVHSGRNLPPGRAPVPVITEIACDHVTYFGTAAGLGAVAAALAVEPGGAG